MQERKCETSFSIFYSDILRKCAAKKNADVKIPRVKCQLYKKLNIFISPLLSL